MTEREVLAERAAKNEIQNTSWHALTEQETLDQFGVTRDGLRSAEIEPLQQEFGRNVFPEQEPLPLWRIILSQFLSPLIYILLAAAAVSIAIGEITDAVFIFAVLLINAALGAYQEYQAEQNAAALQSLLKITARVRRGGHEQELDAEELVPGDVVLLESGDRVPADMRLVSANNLAVDESFLTGESEAARKDASVQFETDTTVSDRSNMVFAGGTVMSGRATGVVTATGLGTEIGKIADVATSGEATKAPLVVRMDRFVRFISFAVLGAMALLVLISVLQGVPFAEVFFLSVALAVSAIPEGLPVALTVALSIAVNRMSKRRVIVRKMPAVEGLGSCTLIASDKTGTLTVNRQTVKTIALPGGERFGVSGEGYNGDGAITTTDGDPLPDAERSRLNDLVRAGVLCNEGDLRREGDEWKYSGDAVDIGFLALGYKAAMPPHELRNSFEIVNEIPFESERAYAAVAYRDSNRVRVAVKGAAERLVAFCTTMRVDGADVDIDRQQIEQQANALAEEGFRVIAVAEGQVPREASLDGFEEDDLPPLTLLGLIGMIDPLRPEAKEAVETCQRAGVQVAMVTGDHPATALAISRELGLAKTDADVLIGRDLPDPEQDPQGFAEKVRPIRVFARVSPLQKMHIVEAMRGVGHFVAVTGDGVNDAPALRAANIGVAMGSGTDVAKDTASIIVTDDNFASIVNGVEEGRYAYDNVRKVIYLLVSTGAAEIALFLIAILVGLPLPLLAVQILWLNLVTNGIQGVALAFEGGEPGAMKRPPRAPTEGIFNSLMIQQVLLSGFVMFAGSIALWIWLLNTGWAEDEARNLLLLLMVLFQNFHVFNTRSEYVSAFRVPLRRNIFLVIGVLAALGIHILAMYVPFMQNVLGVAPVSWTEFLTMVAIASSILFVLEIFKLIRGGERAREREGKAAQPV